MSAGGGGGKCLGFECLLDSLALHHDFFSGFSRRNLSEESAGNNLLYGGTEGRRDGVPEWGCGEGQIALHRLLTG